MNPGLPAWIRWLGMDCEGVVGLGDVFGGAFEVVGEGMKCCRWLAWVMVVYTLDKTGEGEKGISLTGFDHALTL